MNDDFCPIPENREDFFAVPQFSHPMKAFQYEIGVTPDGAFGPRTFKAGQQHLRLADERAVHFFAQCSHETGEFRLFEENLNYSASALRRVFRRYFTPEQARQYARRPAAIASRVYGNRMGNGPESTGDGWKYRGRGALQLTGRNNYEAFAEYVGDPRVVTDPDIVEFKYPFQTALFYFDKNRLWDICDQGYSYNTIKLLTRRINGGYNGLDHRVKLTNRYKHWV